MLIKKLFIAMLACVYVMFPNISHAWGQNGHRITGNIAETYISDDARKAIQEILENEDLAEISTYADENRSNPAKFWQEEAGPYHYVTVPKGKVYQDVGAPQEGDSYTAIKMFTMQLKNPQSSREEKQLALKMLVHIIGDLHQPLHAGNGTDRGGNDFKVEFFWDDSNLHRVWDSGLIDRMNLSYTEYSERLVKKITKEQFSTWNISDPLIYIKESADIRDEIYPSNDKISWQYLYDHRPTMERRLQQAGIRIAAHLNMVFSQ